MATLLFIEMFSFFGYANSTKCEAFEKASFISEYSQRIAHKRGSV